jgi:hypothetical protein
MPDQLRLKSRNFHGMKWPASLRGMVMVDLHHQEGDIHQGIALPSMEDFG